MLSNVLLWIAYGIVGVLAVEFLLIRRELKKIYYRSISYRETLDRSLAEVRNKGEEIIKKIEVLEKSLAEIKGDVHSETCRLEGKIADMGKGITETRFNDFLNYSMRLLEEAKSKGCIEENLYNTLLELFHNLKVDHYIKEE